MTADVIGGNRLWPVSLHGLPLIQVRLGSRLRRGRRARRRILSTFRVKCISSPSCNLLESFGGRASRLKEPIINRRVAKLLAGLRPIFPAQAAFLGLGVDAFKPFHIGGFFAWVLKCHRQILRRAVAEITVSPRVWQRLKTSGRRPRRRSPLAPRRRR